jgi:hypothetical protein
MPFEKGQSGNPAGRPRGSRSRATMALQDMLERDAESIARTAINLAKHGNIAALRICMDRLLPPRRHEPVTLDLPSLDKVADTVAATSAIVAAVAAGDLTAAEAADLAKVVDVHVQALATAAFEGAPGPAGTKSRALIPRAAVGRPVCKARGMACVR